MRERGHPATAGAIDARSRAEGLERLPASEGTRSSTWRSRRGRRESGQILIFFAAAVFALVTLVAVVINLGIVSVAGTEIQNATGQASLAATTRYNACPKGAAVLSAGARARASEVAGSNRVAGDAFSVAAGDVELGFIHPVSRDYEALPAGEAYVGNTARVTGRRSAGSGGPIDLVMSGLLGVSGVDRTSVAYSMNGGPGLLNTDMALALNECGLLAAAPPGDDPVDYDLTVSFLTPDLSRGAFAARPFNVNTRSYAVCPPPLPPVPPAIISNPIFSTDPLCNFELAFTALAIGFNLICEGSPTPPAACAGIGDNFGEPIILVREDLLLHSSFIHPLLAFGVSGGNLDNLIGDYIVPVYSSEEFPTFSSFNFTDTLIQGIDLDPFDIDLGILGGVTIDLAINFNWPVIQNDVRYSPVIGFAQYRVTAATPIQTTLTLNVELNGTCTNNGIGCGLANCCSSVEDQLPLSIDLPLELTSGIAFDGEVLRGIDIENALPGGGQFGLSATDGTGPLLIEPST